MSSTNAEAKALLEEKRQEFERQSAEACVLKLKYHEQAQLAYAMKKELDALEASLQAGEEDGKSEDEEEPLEPLPVDEDVDEAIVNSPGAKLLSNMCVVLVRVSGPGNLGQTCRLCANMGVTDLRIVSPLCDVNCSQSRKFAVHNQGLLVNAPIFDNLQDAIADCGIVIGTSGKSIRESVIKTVMSPEQVLPYCSERQTEKYAIVFGNESDGLDVNDLRLCNATVYIPTVSYPSYNLSHAIGIVLYTILRTEAGDSRSAPEVSAALAPRVCDVVVMFSLPSIFFVSMFV